MGQPGGEKLTARVQVLISPDCVFDASLVPETCPGRLFDLNGLINKFLESRNRKLTFAPFLARLEGAGVPGLILDMYRAEPPAADTGMDSCDGFAGLICG